MRRDRYIIIAIIVLTASLITDLYASDGGTASKKFTYRYDNVRSGYTDAGVKPPLRLEWFRNTSLKGEYIYKPMISCSLIGDGNILYFGTLEKTFSAFDINKKEVLWQYMTSGDVSAGATMDETRIFFGDTKGYLYCLNKESGELIWRREFSNEILSSPLIVGDKLFFSDMGDTLYAVSTDTAETIWKVEIESYLNNIVMRDITSPSYKNGYIYQGASDGYLYCFNAETSEELYRKKIKGDGKFIDVDSPVAVDGETVYSVSHDGKLLAIRTKAPETVWSVKIKGNGYCAVNGDTLITSSTEGVLYSIDKVTGNITWERELSKNLAAPVITDDHVFVASEDYFYALDIKTGEVMYEYEPGSGINSELCLIDDKLYFLSNKGYLYCFSSY